MCTYRPELFHSVTTIFSDTKQLELIHVYIHTTGVTTTFTDVREIRTDSYVHTELYTHTRLELVRNVRSLVSLPGELHSQELSGDFLTHLQEAAAS